MGRQNYVLISRGDLLERGWSCSPAVLHGSGTILGLSFPRQIITVCIFLIFIHTMNTLLNDMGNYAFCRKTNASMHVQGLLALNMVFVVVVLTSWAHPTLGSALLVPIHRL